jgi:hypothetical protein
VCVCVCVCVVIRFLTYTDILWVVGHESLSSPISNNDDLMANASGGSSPSREVQEILCLQDNNKYYDDTDEIILDEADGLLGVDELNDLENDINEDEESYNYKRSDESKGIIKLTDQQKKNLNFNDHYHFLKIKLAIRIRS